MGSASVHVMVVAETPFAFLPLGQTSVASVAVQRAQSAACRPVVSLWLGPEVRPMWSGLDDRLKPVCAVAPNRPLADAACQVEADVVLIHDAQRPLTLPTTFDRVAQAVSESVTAARPSHVVVDTLKLVDADYRVLTTVNRDTVSALTSPEAYWRAAIVGGGSSDGWSLTVTAPESREFVRGDQESLRVREPADVLLVESFLAWQTR